MHSDKESRTNSESSFNFGFKIELDNEGRRTFNREEGFAFEEFGFGDAKSR